MKTDYDIFLEETANSICTQEHEFNNRANVRVALSGEMARKSMRATMSLYAYREQGYWINEVAFVRLGLYLPSNFFFPIS